MKSIVINGSAKCIGCVKCIKHCQVKSISHDGSHASILDTDCLVCGKCIDACPNGYIELRDDIAAVRRLIKENDKVVASISPQWLAEFGGIGLSRMVEALHLLGFSAVSDSSSAAGYLRDGTMASFEGLKGGVYISSLCPVVTSMVEKHFPSAVDKIIPMPSISLLHARMLKSHYGSDTLVVTITGCVAAKQESLQNSEEIAAAITFEELSEWFAKERIDFDKIMGGPSYQMAPLGGEEHRRHIIPGGLFNTDYMASVGRSDIVAVNVSGQNRIQYMLSDIDYDNLDYPLFLDLYACEEGCLTSEGSIAKRENVAKGLRFINRLSGVDLAEVTTTPLIVNGFNSVVNYTAAQVSLPVSEQALADTYNHLGVKQGGSSDDCGACGYRSCHDFAVSLNRGNVIDDMCIVYRNQAIAEQFSAYISTSRSGIFIVDQNMCIVRSNKVFSSLFTVSQRVEYDKDLGLRGADITSLVPFHKSIKTLLSSNDTDIWENDFQHQGRMLTVTLIALRSQNKVCGIVRNLFSEDIAREEIINKTRKVIDRNLETIQKIAYLLGDTASETEAVLNSIIESQEGSYE